MAFPGTGKIWMNGSLVEWKDAKIHIGSHIVHYGSGVFEGARCYDTLGGPACFRLDAHIRRLMDSARIYRMDSPYNEQQITDAIFDLIQVNAFRAHVEILTSSPSSIASFVKYAPHSHSMIATSTGQGSGLTPSES